MTLLSDVAIIIGAAFALAYMLTYVLNKSIMNNIYIQYSNWRNKL